jgi:hypothetical protein
MVDLGLIIIHPVRGPVEAIQIGRPELAQVGLVLVGFLGVLDESLLELASPVLATGPFDLAFELTKLALLVLVHGGPPPFFGQVLVNLTLGKAFGFDQVLASNSRTWPSHPARSRA